MLSRTVHETVDPEWELARSVEVVAVHWWGRPVDGVVLARQHATGWFLKAEHRSDLDAATRVDFSEFLLVRVYLLLTRGPAAGGWVASRPEGLWRVDFTAAEDVFESSA
jgi:hypothetical protein